VERVATVVDHPAATGRRQRSAPLSREKVVAVAAEVADHDGIDAVTLTRVAEELGCHVTSLRNHVTTIAELHRHMALLGVAELKESIWEAAVGRSGEDALRRIAAAYRHYGEQHPGLAQAIRTYRNDDDPEFVATALKTVAPILTTLQSFGLSEEQAAVMHRVFSSAIAGFTNYVAVGMYRGAEADAVYEHIVALLVHGLTDRTWLPGAKRTTTKRSVPQ
jgi:AcrR family transcriptional regulator